MGGFGDFFLILAHPLTAYRKNNQNTDRFNVSKCSPNLRFFFSKARAQSTSTLDLNTDFYGFTGLKGFRILTILNFCKSESFDNFL